MNCESQEIQFNEGLANSMPVVSQVKFKWSKYTLYRSMWALVSVWQGTCLQNPETASQRKPPSPAPHHMRTRFLSSWVLSLRHVATSRSLQSTWLMRWSKLCNLGSNSSHLRSKRLMSHGLLFVCICTVSFETYKNIYYNIQYTKRKYTTYCITV